ncbi:MAG: tRNA (N(6)-L-threonylcarbamoyladenosine(37)-C(2))-methylthiotransferase [Kosmotogaceae bacterium]|nr:tRNA (N(6)-L-threonylcarbamoyladenosine(37)-C(2))-methylthiotransferase [Kosmotogaceae bacterium]
MKKGSKKKETRVYGEVYGCPSNISDYEISFGMLREMGYEIVDEEDEADVVVLFTCIVKIPTEQRMINRIKELGEKEKPLIVAGCMTKTSQRTIENIYPEASMMGPDSIDHIGETIDAALKGEKVMFLKDERNSRLKSRRHRKNPEIGIIPISIGCMSNCSYCAVKIARGRLRSYFVKDIVDNVKRFVDEGLKEIWITSQDNGCYGLDIGSNIIELLKKIVKIEGDFTVRVGMMNPTYIKDEETLRELLEIFRSGKIQKFIHVPVQSGSDKILNVMKRGYRIEDFKKVVRAFEEEIPDITISTDIIVGFPGESEIDFEKTLELVREIRPGKLNISKFGKRPGTEASEMGGQVPYEVIKERTKRLHSLVVSIKEHVKEHEKTGAKE